MSELKPVRFGIIGCGTASIPVCEAITSTPLTHLVSVYDVNEDLASDLGQRFRVPPVKTLDELLENPSVDAVYIAVPHSLLAPLARKVLEAGKHALVEKPLAISLEDVDCLIGLAQERKLRLGVFYEMRYAPAHDKARELVQAGAIGDVIGVLIQTLIDKPLSYWQSGYAGRSVNPWRGIKAQAGGGVLLMNTSHLLDALFYITGLQVASLSAEVGTLVANVEVEDLASATLRFNNGAIGSLIAGAHIRGAQYEERCSIFGTQVQVRLPDPYGSEPLQIYLSRPWAEFTSGDWHSIPSETMNVYQCAIEDYARAVQSSEDVPIDAGAARQVLAVILAIYQSAAEKRTISIP